jgi:hypothetical protein
MGATQTQEFADELRRMADANIDFFTQHKPVMEALAPDIEAGARFVNIFRAPKEPLLVVTSASVSTIRPRLLRTPRVQRIPLADVRAVDVERQLLRRFVSIWLNVTGSDQRLSYQFGFESPDGPDPYLAQERLRVATANAGVAAAEIRRWAGL